MVHLRSLSGLIPEESFLTTRALSRSGPKESPPGGPNFLGTGDIGNSRDSVGPVWLWGTLFLGVIRWGII